jgi:parallel beta-helix repeat protein
MDGAILINQAKVLAGSVTPGDTPGFPVTISKPGNYTLSGNLTVPRGGVNGIVLKTSNVTINLNGFQISSKPGTGEPAGSGITDNNASRKCITVRNGTIVGCQFGVNLSQSQAVVEGVQTSCVLGGISAGPYSSVKNNIVEFAVGIGVGDSSIVSGNIVSHCDMFSLSAGSGCIVCDNVVNDNFTGISVGTDCVVKDNVALRNDGIDGCRGIGVGANSTVIGNTASGNGPSGGITIACPCTVIGNTAVNNTGGNIVYSGTGCTKANNTAP